MTPRARAEQIARLSKRYADSKRGPFTIRFLVNEEGRLKVVASLGELETTVEVTPAELDPGPVTSARAIAPNSEATAKVCEAIETTLARMRDIMARRPQ